MQLFYKKDFFFENIKFIVIIFMNLITSINSDDDFIIEFQCEFPRSFSLYNENHILCCKEGIYTFNSNFTEQLFFHEFSSQLISKNSGFFVTFAQFPNNGNVIIITEEKFYLMSSEGEFLYDDDLPFEKACSYYTLIPFIYGKNYNFVIGSLNNFRNLNLLYFNINNSTKKIDLIKNYIPLVLTGSGTVGENYNQGFSCQIMKSNYKKILVCFCPHGYPLEIVAFRIQIDTDIKMINNSFTYLSLTSQANYLQTIASQDKYKCLIVFSDNDGIGHYTIYDIRTSKFSEKVPFMTLSGNYASSISVQFFPRTQEYIVMSNSEKEVKIAKFDKNMNRIKNENMNEVNVPDFILGSDYHNVNFYNIAFIPEYENYIFIADGNYKGITNARIYIFPDAFKPDEISPFPIYFEETEDTNPSSTHLTNVVSSAMTTLPYTSIYTASSTINHLSTTTVTSVKNYLTTTVASTINHLTTTTVTSVKNNLSTTTATSVKNHLSTTTASSVIHYSSTTSPSNNENENYNDVVCSVEFFYKNVKTNQCENICSDYEFLNDICYINDINENNIMNITDHIRNLINKIEVNKNTNVVINGNNVVYQFISSEAMDENLDKNISIIDFGECEKKLKNEFNIDFILVLQLDVFLSTSTNIVLKYEVYNPFNLEKINLSLCKDMEINTYLPYDIPDEELDKCISAQESGYDIYNPNDSFYLDTCTPYTTFNKTDILLSDRRKDYYKNNSFCEEGCVYKSYNCTTKKVQCDCKIKTKMDSNITNVKFNSMEFVSSFFSLENFSNIRVVKCFKLVFSLLGQTLNFGSYIFIVFNVTYIVLIVLFCKDGKKKFFELINTVLRSQNIKNPLKKKKKKHKIKQLEKGNNKIIINKNIIINNHYRNINDKSSGLLEPEDSTKKSYSKLFLRKKTEKIHKLSGKKKKKPTELLIHKGKKRNNKKEDTENKGAQFVQNYQDLHYNDYELNSLTYEKAIIYDNRTYLQYYCSLLKEKHLIIFTFISSNDYNLFIIKLSLFIFSVSLNFAVNTLFFTDTIIHKIYEKPTTSQLIYSLMNILYSTIISSTISISLKLLALSNKSILKLKTDNNKMKNKNKKKKIKYKKKNENKIKKYILRESDELVKDYNLKFNIFYLVSFIFMLAFWYFISAFCAVYKNSQIYLIENTLCSLATSLVYPFGLNLIPGMFRITALRSKNKKCVYTVGNFIAII